jgi:SNF2 family DNA or RNA helicase
MTLSDLVSTSVKNTKSKEKCCYCLKRYSKKKNSKSKNDEDDENGEDEDDIENEFANSSSLKHTKDCGHYYCDSCITFAKHKCKLCKIQEETLKRGPSSKVQAIIKTLKEQILLNDETKKDKVIICSQFSGFLDVLEYWIKNQVLESEEFQHITIQRYDGDLTAPQKEQVLQNFEKDENCQILLMTIQTGGVGMNVQFANHLFITEPNYDPHLIEQAKARVRRLGQTKRIYRYSFLTELPEHVSNSQGNKSVEYGKIF